MFEQMHHNGSLAVVLKGSKEMSRCADDSWMFDGGLL